MVDLKLRDYQLEDVKFMCQNGRVYNTNEPGLGKTIETLTAAKQLRSRHTLIIGPKVSLGVWQSEALLWHDEESMVYAGTPKKRKQIWEAFIYSPCRILISTFKMMEEISMLQKEWDTIIIDEIHLAGLLNHASLTFRQCRMLQSTNLFLLTGTPIRRGPQDLWTALYLLDKKAFPSFWAFVHTYCIVEQGLFGKEIGNKPKDPVRFKQMLKPYLIRRRKQDVIAELPDKIRSAVPLEMSNTQRKIYEQLVKDMMADLPNGDMIVAPNMATVIMRLRQLLVSPSILGGGELGVAIEALVELIEIEFEAHRAVVVFTPFRSIIETLDKYLTIRLNATCFQIHGKITELANTVASRFQAHTNHRKILIGTISTGVSYTAHSASTAFFLGCEWGADRNKQAEDRIHRIGQKETVFIKYLVFKDTVDDLVMQKLNQKQGAEDWILRTEDVIARLQRNKKNL